MKQMSKGEKKKEKRGKPKNQTGTTENKQIVPRGDVGGRMCDMGDGDKEDTYHNEH